MSDTPTAALAAALRHKTNYLFAPEEARARLTEALLADLTEQGWELVPSGSLLDMARVLIALADHIDGIGYGDATEDHPMASVVIAAAREMVAAEPGT